MDRALEAVRTGGAAPVPLHLRNAPTRLLAALGHGAEYRYPHDAPDGFVDAWNLPAVAGAARYYEPTRQGAEGAISDRLAGWRERRRPPKS